MHHLSGRRFPYIHLRGIRYESTNELQNSITDEFEGRGDAPPDVLRVGPPTGGEAVRDCIDL